MASNIKTIKKLQMAINTYCDFKILYQTSQFYSPSQKRPVTKYILRKAVINPETLKNETEEIFSTYSQLQVILYLRDLWYLINGNELPTDNELWQAIKEKNNITYEGVIT